MSSAASRYLRFGRLNKLVIASWTAFTCSASSRSKLTWYIATAALTSSIDTTRSSLVSIHSSCAAVSAVDSSAAARADSSSSEMPCSVMPAWTDRSLSRSDCRCAASAIRSLTSSLMSMTIWARTGSSVAASDVKKLVRLTVAPSAASAASSYRPNWVMRYVTPAPAASAAPARPTGPSATEAIAPVAPTSFIRPPTVPSKVLLADRAISGP